MDFESPKIMQNMRCCKNRKVGDKNENVYV